MMGLEKILAEHREEIIKKWSYALRTKVGERYRRRPSRELIALTSEATDANYVILINNDFTKIDHFIEKITKLRLESGFTLSEVQKAFDLYRLIVVPIITQKMKGNELSRALKKLNYCLSYTITRFSDYFQSLHEKAVRDYAQNLKTEVEIRTRQLAESESLARIGQLTTSLAHELRNPLSSIKMTIQMLLETMNLNGDNKKAVEISAKQISRLERILSEMLDFARPVRLAQEPSSVNEIIRSCLEILDAKIREKRVTVKTSLPVRTPPVLIDREKIEQVVINILLNAIELIPIGGVIWVKTEHKRERQSSITVKITDNGPGIDRSDLPYIFDPFFSKKKKGTGLGLWNVKKIVEAHGGSVSAAGRQKGFCISFMLPLGEKHE
jgi:signal transduction histidine kinase